MSEGAAGVQAARLERAVGVDMTVVSPDDHKEEP